MIFWRRMIKTQLRQSKSKLNLIVKNTLWLLGVDLRQQLRPSLIRWQKSNESMHRSWPSRGQLHWSTVCAFSSIKCSEISRNEDQLSELLLYKEFLDTLAPPVRSYNYWSHFGIVILQEWIEEREKKHQVKQVCL